MTESSTESPKELLFISHAVPSDDYLAVWLASKLSLMGYDVWVDKEDLRSGSAFWNEIELRMRNDSIRFLALVSESYIKKALDKDTGVFSEVTLAKALSKKMDKYIIPIKVDDCSYDDFPINILPLDAIDFSKNWGTGLKKLLKELDLQLLPRNSSANNVLTRWHKFQGITGETVKQHESYGSNWLRTNLPKVISVYKFRGEISLIKKEVPFQFVRNGDYYLGLFDDEGLTIRTDYRQDIPVLEFLERTDYILESGDEIKDTHPKMVVLMNKAIYNFFYFNDDFRAYPISNKKLVVYPINTRSKSGYVSFKRNGKNGRRHLKGRKPVNWSFGLSFVFQLTPFPHFVANHHILSSDENGFFGKDDQIKYRRSIPSGWFNRDWFERLLAFMNLANGLSGNDTLTFRSGREYLNIDLSTEEFQSDYGYKES